MADEDEEALVTIETFWDTVAAEMARGRLESAGIHCFLTGENAARLYGTGLGDLQLQVSPEDEADARAILSDPGDPDPAFDESSKK